MQGMANKAGTGYLFAAPEFEFANLARAYKRYSLNVGGTLTVLPRIPITASVGYGITDH